MSVRVSPAALTTTTTTTLPSFAQSFHPASSSSSSYAMRPTNPVREQRTTAMPTIAALSSSAPEHEQQQQPPPMRKRPRRSSRGGVDGSGSESPRVVRVKEEVDELLHDAAPPDVHHQPRSFAAAAATVAGDPHPHDSQPQQQQQPHQAKKRRTVAGVGKLNTDVPTPGGSSAPISPVIYPFPRSDDTHARDKLAPYPQPGGTGTSPRSTAPPRLSLRVPSPPAAMAAPLAQPSASFANRRAAGSSARRKPADLLLRQDGSAPPAPVIQSAPAVPRGDILPGRFPSIEMPTLPSALGVLPTVRRVAGQVPPTPNRPTAAHRANSGPTLVAPPTAAIAKIGRSPPGLALATSLVPPTPTILRNPGPATEKSAFLAPFESFYDALADAKELKTWLHENAQRASALAASLERQQQHMDDAVQAAVERAVAPVRDEVRRLRERVVELEAGQRAHPLRAMHSGGSPADAYGTSSRPHLGHYPSSPALASVGTASPAPYDARRQPTSAMRTTTDASRQLVPLTTLTHGASSSAARDRDRHDAAYHGHSPDLPSLSRGHSTYSTDERERERGRERSRSPPRRSSRNSRSPGRSQPHSRSPGQ